MNKEQQAKLFIKDEDLSWEILDAKVKRKIMAYESSIMMVKVSFMAGGVGEVHKHVHVQMSLVESGIFEVEIDGVKSILKKGDVFHIPSNVLHGAVCIEDGVLIDVFSPMREDFIQHK
jgi:quercetin dioxygenase-like cupin family protein